MRLFTMEVSERLAAILILFTWVTTSFGCEEDDVAVYNIKLRFLQENLSGYDTSGFQWSNIFGQSHNRSYALYKVGEETGPLIKSFIKSGSSEGFREAADEEPKVYDQFTAVVDDDHAEGILLVNGGHNLVSLICQMTSSPHWFVGVDSLPLCINSFWVDQVTLELDPMDLIAINNFSDESPEIVKRVSLHSPRDSKHIAKVEFTKVKEYSTPELNSLARKELMSEIKSNNGELPRQKSYYDDAEMDSNEELASKTRLETLKALEEEPLGTPKPELAENKVIIVTRAPAQRRKYVDNGESYLKSMDEVMLAVANGNNLGLGKHLPRHFKSRLHHAVNRHLDCQVGDWSDWSSCTEPCGNGHTVRMRTITRQREGEGRGCPHLIESKTCGQPCRGDDDYTTGN